MQLPANMILKDEIYEAGREDNSLVLILLKCLIFLTFQRLLQDQYRPYSPRLRGSSINC